MADYWIDFISLKKKARIRDEHITFGLDLYMENENLEIDIYYHDDREWLASLGVKA